METPLGDTNMNSDVIFQVSPSFLEVGPGSCINRPIPGLMDHDGPFVALGLGPGQETLMV